MRKILFAFSITIATALADSLWYTPALAQREYGLNLTGYCQSIYGGQSRSVLFDQTSAYSWRCTVGNEFAEISIEDACRIHHGIGWRAEVKDLADPYSWVCRLKTKRK
jgi:hypothetical protein